MFALVASIIARTSAVLGRARSAADANGDVEDDAVLDDDDDDEDGAPGELG